MAKKEQNLILFEVVIANGDKIEADEKVMAASAEKATMDIVAKNSENINKDTEVFTRPFCEGG